jgi:hypothetical protein
LSDTAATVLIDAGFGMYHARDQGVILSLRKPALQRLINHRLSARENPEQSIVVRVLIRFLMAEIDLPKPPRTSTSNGSSRSNQGSVRSRHTNNPSSLRPWRLPIDRSYQTGPTAPCFADMLLIPVRLRIRARPLIESAPVNTTLLRNLPIALLFSTLGRRIERRPSFARPHETTHSLPR